ncbi:MAG: tRNA epoxyqueuosine(34) reductase QueG [Lentisphaerae bacterium]|nr:tRNA epoxyqueuosine(34) reductase QueG [Lentisphaerota bacterium]
MELLIQREAERLGFAACGIVTLGPARTFDRFQNWLELGYAAGMAYLQRRVELRSHPMLVAPEARAAIVVAARYPATVPLQPFSNYAVGKDYHAVLRARLKQLAAAIKANCPVKFWSRICVDSAPVLEREWAVRAGLGWIGRQGSLVNAEWGTTLFLGELLVNLELKPTVASGRPNKCGACRKCVEACPTGAIQPDGLVDARRCISYLTIEHEGEIPEALRGRLGGSLFGCDRCTVVCPYNPAGDAAILPEFKAAARPMPTAEQCLELSVSDFRQKFRDTAIYRSGLARLQRNAIIALAKSKRLRSALSACSGHE